MGRLLDEYIRRHNLPDTIVLSVLGTGCIMILQDDNVPVIVKARVEELEQDAHRVLENVDSIMFSMRGGFTSDPTSKDRQ